jgi:hypothetical protein
MASPAAGFSSAATTPQLWQSMFGGMHRRGGIIVVIIIIMWARRTCCTFSDPMWLTIKPKHIPRATLYAGGGVTYSSQSLDLELTAVACVTGLRTDIAECQHRLFLNRINRHGS